MTGDPLAKSIRDAGSPLHVIVLMPVRNDWVAASKVIRGLDHTVSAAEPGVSLDVLIVDDGSSEPWTEAQFCPPYACVSSINVLKLYRNLGHQRAIAVGLVHIESQMRGDAILVMDADGEDTPDGAVELLRAFKRPEWEGKLIFAQRGRRAESLTFKLFYHLYRGLHYGLTGVSVRVGNFSIVPWGHLSGITVLSETWNHYAAAIYRSGLPFGMIPIARGRRLAGESRMNFVSLVMHGLSAVSVYADVVGARLLVIFVGGSILAACGIAAMIAFRLFSDAAIPAWATYSAGMLAIISIQLITVAACFTFLMLAARATNSFIPRRDAMLFAREVVAVYQRG